MPEKTSIQVSRELLKELKFRGDLGETYEDVIWKLIKRNDKNITRLFKNVDMDALKEIFKKAGLTHS